MVERRCIASGQVLDVSKMIRFVVGPNQDLVPDLAGKLPGRGLWVTARADAIALATKKKAFARAARCQVNVAGDLIDLIEKQLRRKCLDRVSLARRAGQAVAGFDKVMSLIARGRAKVLLTARDAGKHGRLKLQHKAEKLPVIELFDGNELSLAFGRENVVHAALTLGGFADHLLEDAERLRRFGMADAGH